jgi:cytochrome c-type biogenesis protein CcmH
MDMKMLKTVRSLVCLAAIVMAAQVQPQVLPLLAQVPGDEIGGPLTPHPAADEAIARLKSPYCPGQMLEVCSSYTGALLRDSMQAMAREGWTTDELVDWVLANHGEQYLAYPDASGAGLLAWLVPPAALFLGIVVVVAVLRYMRKSAPPEEIVDIELSEEEEERLRKAIAEMEEAEEPAF